MHSLFPYWATVGLLYAFTSPLRSYARPAAAFLEAHCADCHDAETKKGGLDLSSLQLDAASLGTWVKVHDRLAAGEMPPPNKAQPSEAEKRAALAVLAQEISHTDAGLRKEGRSSMRRLTRVELENTLRDILDLPQLSIADSQPADGKYRGFDRSASALDYSFAHAESLLAAIDTALDLATPAFAERPVPDIYRYSPWHNVRKNGKECEGDAGLALESKTAILLNGMARDTTFSVPSAFQVQDHEPLANAIAFFRLEDADYRIKLTNILPTAPGYYKLRVSGYSIGWDGQQVVPTDRHGALGWGIFAKGLHFGTVDLPPNKPATREITAWIDRGGGLRHGTDDWLRIIASSCENFRDYAHGKNKDVPGPMSPAPGVAVEWVEIEGPVFEQWPPRSQKILFGDLPVRPWTKESGRPKPVTQTWGRGHPETFPKDPYGHRNEKQPVVEVVSQNPAADAARLMPPFLQRAFRREATAEEIAAHLAIFTRRHQEGDSFQDALKAAYRAALAAPATLMQAPSGLAARLAFFLWAGPPDDRLLDLEKRGELVKNLLQEAARLLGDPKAKRFTDDFTGQWLRLRDINATQPDKQLYPEFTPLLQEAMLGETRAYFQEMLRTDAGVTHFVKSTWAMLNEPLARLYGIPGVAGHEIRRVKLPPDTPRGAFLTQAAVLKTTANGTTTSPVTRGAFVLERLLGVIPEPPPPDAGSIEPDTRGAATIREQLEKHKRNATCAGCHVKMDPYGFALEAFDVVGEFRSQYRARGHKGDWQTSKKVHGHTIQYHPGLPVDASGQLPDGRKFSDIRQLQDLMAADPKPLARAFLGQLLTYATGSEPSFSERPEIERLVAATESKGYGIRSLLLALVQSPLFSAKP